MNAIDVPIALPALLAPFIGGVTEVTVQASSIQEALDKLLLAQPKLRVHLYDQDGAQRQHVLILYNGQSIRWFPSLDAPLSAGDSITILQLVSGG